MIKNTWSGHGSARFIYYSYKDSPYYSLLVLAIISSACLIIIFNILLPQLDSWFTIRDEALATRQRIDIINNNTTYMTNLNKEILENNRQAITGGLPIEKDFSAIVNAINLSSLKANVSVEDFSFGIGPIATQSANPRLKNSSLDSTSVAIALKGKINNAKNFLTEISQKLPVSEINSFDSDGETTDITLIFYSKPYKAKDIIDEEPVMPVSIQTGKILSQLSEWQKENGVLIQTPPRSQSVPLF